jgi:hypothetical protein
VERGWVVVIVVVVFGTLLGPEITGLLLRRGVVSWWARFPVVRVAVFRCRVVGGWAGAGRGASVGWGVLFLVFPRRLVAFAPVMGVPFGGGGVRV